MMTAKRAVYNYGKKGSRHVCLGREERRKGRRKQPGVMEVTIVAAVKIKCII
jgi:hypothetical protein